MVDPNQVSKWQPEAGQALTEPIRMFGAYVLDFTSSVGYGAESSTLQMKIAEDPNNKVQSRNATGELLYFPKKEDGTDDTTQTTTAAIDEATSAKNTKVMESAPVLIHHYVYKKDSDGVPQKTGSGEFIMEKVDGFPEVGTACQFKFQGFEFAGIFQRHSYSESTGGRTYDIVFESPSKALDGVQVIMGDFNGSSFQQNNMLDPAGFTVTKWDNAANCNQVKMPDGTLCGYECKDVYGSPLFTSQIRNVYNPYGVLSNYRFLFDDDSITTGRGFFSQPDVNKYGMRLMDTSTTLRGLGLLSLIENISKSGYRYTPYTLNSSTSSPTKMTNVNTRDFPDTFPSTDAYVVPEYDDSEVIGGPVHYGESLMTIDFTELKEAIGRVITDDDFLRMKGPIQTVNAVVKEACEMIVHDYVCVLDLVPAPTDLVTPNLAGSGTGNIAFASEGDVVNGVIPQLYEENDPKKPVIGPAISFKMLDKSTPPESGVIEQLISDYKGKDNDENFYMSSSHGAELSDVVTQKLLLGGKASRIFEACALNYIPAFGKKPNGDWNVGSGFSDSDILTAYDAGAGLDFPDVTMLELRCALAGEDTWVLYNELRVNYGLSVVQNMGIHSRFSLAGLDVFNKVKKGFSSMGAALSGYSGKVTSLTDAYFHPDNLTNRSDITQMVGYESRWDTILHYAQNYYGKTFFVRLPVEPGGQSNNIRFKDDAKHNFESAWEISESGWDPSFRAKGNFNAAYTDEGKLKASAGWKTQDNPLISTDYSTLGSTFPLVSQQGCFRVDPGEATVGTTDIQIDKQIHYLPTPSRLLVNVNNRVLNNYDPCDERFVEAYVHVTCPQVHENDGNTYLWNYVGNLASQVQDQAINKFGGLEQAAIWQNSEIDSGLTRIKQAPKLVYPSFVCIPQESNMYTWGPWYAYGKTKYGKAAVEQDENLRPEVFGNVETLDKAAFSLVNAATADMYASESGSLSLAAFPQYNMAERFDVNGPYITKMDVSVGTAGMTTNYTFSTWTRNFGKIAKYNIERIADINKARIKRFREGGAGSLGLSGHGAAGSTKTNETNNQELVRNRNGSNFFTGFSFAEEPKLNAGGANANPFHKRRTSWDMSMIFGGAAHPDFVNRDYYDEEGNYLPTLRANAVDPNTIPEYYQTYNRMFGCTPEQIFTPVGIKNTPNDGKRGDTKLGYELLPYVLKNKKTTNIAGQEDSKGDFDEGNVLPTSHELDPYFYPQRQGGVLDYGAVVMNDYEWFAGAENNIHLQNNEGKIPTPVNAEVRTYGMRTPMLLSGWGYDICGNHAPSENSDPFPNNLVENAAKNRSLWKTGPLHVMWDDERQVWAGGLQFLEGKLKDAVEPATDGEPTTATMEVYRRNRKATQFDNKGRPTEYDTKWEHEAPDEITLTNRDPSLSVDPGNANYDIYVMAARINYEWRIVYISCDNA
jgi:hypothetical protein